jgi:hypothetical protein
MNYQMVEMTIQYRLLKRPGNFQELSDKISKEGISQVSLQKESRFSLGYSGIFSHLNESTYLRVLDQNGKGLYQEEIGSVRVRSIVTRANPEEFLELGKKVADKAKEWGEYFAKIGLKVSVDQCLIGD